jgi:hypothetical protein
MAALQREIDEQEKLLTELKRKFNSINTLMTEIKQLKAVRQQMVNENQKTYAELKQEFEGMLWCPSLSLVAVSSSHAHVGALRQNRTRSCSLWPPPLMRRWSLDVKPRTRSRESWKSCTGARISTTRPSSASMSR